MSLSITEVHREAIDRINDDNDNFEAIYNAILAKGGTTTHNDRDDYANAIMALNTYSPTLITKQITENGTYDASDDNADGYSEVTVDIDIPTLQSNKNVNVSSNGTTVVTPDSGNDALEQVTINTNVTPNLQQKTATTNGDVTPDSGYDGLSKVTVNVQHTPNNQNKTVNISSNGTTQVTSDQGYDGLGTVTINANVPSGIVDFTGLYIDSTDSITIPTKKIKFNGDLVNLKEAFRHTKDINFDQDLTNNSQDIICYSLQAAFYQYKNNSGTRLTNLNLSRLKLADNMQPDDSYWNNLPLNEIFSKINAENLILDMTVKNRQLKLTFGSDYANQCPIITISGFNIKHENNYPTNNETTMLSTFKQCNELTSISTSDPSTDNTWVIRGGMADVFSACKKLVSIPEIDRRITNGSVNNNMNRAFQGCLLLASVTIYITDETGNNGANTWSMNGIFNGCTALQHIYGNFDMSKVVGTYSAFNACTSLVDIETSGSFGGSIDNTTNSLTLDLSASDVFDANSLIEDLAANNSGKERILKFSATSYSNITSANITLASTKNYVLQSV